MINTGSGMTVILDELSLELNLASPDDLIALGEVLVKLENAMEEFGRRGADEALPALDLLRKTIEAVILEAVPDKAAAMNLAGRGVSLLQEMDRSLNGGASFNGDLAGFIKQVETETGIKLNDCKLEDDIKKVKDEPAADDMSQDQELLFSFLAESMEHIETIEVSIIDLETSPDNLEAINAVFRPFHTIKGVSGFLNLNHIHKLTHELENILDDARSDRIKVTPPLIDLVLDAVDILSNMIKDLRRTEETGGDLPEYGLDAFIGRIHAVRNGEPEEPPEQFAGDFSGLRLGEILVDYGVITENELETILASRRESDLRPLGRILVEKGVISDSDLESALKLQIEDRDRKLGEILVESAGVSPDLITDALNEQNASQKPRLGELLIKEKKAGARDVARALRDQKKVVPIPSGAPRTVKVDTDKLDSLVDLVGELVIAQSMINSSKIIADTRDQKLDRDLAQVTRITSELQKTTMSMRMVPIRQTFQKMIRLVRDLSRKSGKQVELSMSGEDTEIDRNMVEAIYDPLVHMIRNSVDHGIETPQERLNAGKPAQGSILLKAYHQGGDVNIEINDDGRGLDKKKILNKAIERGLIESTATLSDSEIFNLIFHPGFSTADKITDVSGRGVGMDVVKKSIEKLRGKVDVNSVSGRGSVISIQVPLTLAIIDGMIIRAGENRYVLPVTAIRESFAASKDNYYTVEGREELMMVRNTLFPLIRLHDLFNITPDTTDPAEALIIVLENDGKHLCLMVDEVIGKQEVVIKSLGEGIVTPKTVAGGTILGDGRVGLIIDVAGLFENSNASHDVKLKMIDNDSVVNDWEMQIPASSYAASKS